ncbi:unnamed protein product, partial [Cyprideis torosa]
PRSQIPLLCDCLSTEAKAEFCGSWQSWSYRCHGNASMFIIVTWAVHVLSRKKAGRVGVEASDRELPYPKAESLLSGRDGVQGRRQDSVKLTTTQTMSYVISAGVAFPIADKRREHKCPICEKTYPAANKLRYHLKLHSQHPSFICEHCGKEFRRKDRLTAHEKIHSPNRKKSVCVHCGQQFLKSTSLREHLASKHGREEGSKFQTPQGPPGEADHGRSSSSTGSRTLDIPMDEDKEAVRLYMERYGG